MDLAGFAEDMARAAAVAVAVRPITMVSLAVVVAVVVKVAKAVLVAPVEAVEVPPLVSGYTTLLPAIYRKIPSNQDWEALVPMVGPADPVDQVD